MMIEIKNLFGIIQEEPGSVWQKPDYKMRISKTTQFISGEVIMKHSMCHKFNRKLFQGLPGSQWQCTVEVKEK